MQLLPEWVISLIGVGVGALIPISYSQFKEWQRSRKQRREVRSVLTAELTQSLNTLKKLISGMKTEEHSNWDVTRQNEAEFPLDISFYRSINTELLIRSLPSNALMTVHNVYRAIARFNQGIFALGTKHSYIYYAGIRELAKEIDEAIALVRFGDLDV